MALEIKFNLPTPDPGQEAAYKVIIYQSDDSHTWDPTPTIEEFVSNLTIDPGDGKYVWIVTSPPIDASRWVQLKTEDQYGVESNTGLVFSPASLPTAQFGAKKISDGVAIYKIGATIDLMLQLHTDDAATVGNTIQVEIRDACCDHILSTLTASLIGDNLYVAEYTIPYNLDDIYNIDNVYEEDLSVYSMKDRWIFPDATQIEYSFFIDRSGVESAVQDDSLYTISIDNLNDTGIEESVKFASHLTYYYAPVDDVIAVSAVSLEDTNVFDIAKQIKIVSEYVDNHMRPLTIVNQNAFDSAVKCFVRHTAAANLLREDLKVNSETKQLDTFMIQRSYDTKRYLDDLDGRAYQCALVIWAGGNDTPFVTRRFQKGLYDPNRPNVSRAKLDISDNKPWVNVTTKPLLALDADGQPIEVRGIRTIRLPSAEKSLL